jgi:hypothetical protein
LASLSANEPASNANGARTRKTYAWDQHPDDEPNMDRLALLCGRCRELAEGKKADLNELRSIRNALWNNVPAVAEGAALVLARCKEGWAREAIEESFIDDTFKAGLLR